MNTRNNARYAETDRKIRKAFLEELEHNPIENIKVSGICDTIHINRSSFYAHYDDIYDILQTISNEVGEQLFDRFSSMDHPDSQSIVTKEFLLELLNHIYDHKKFYTAYFSSISLDGINKGLDSVFENIIKYHLQKLGVDDKAASIHFIFFKAGLLAVIQYWLKTDCTQRPEEIADIIWMSLRERTAGLAGPDSSGAGSGAGSEHGAGLRAEESGTGSGITLEMN